MIESKSKTERPKVFIVLRHEYESESSREFSPSTTVEGVFSSKEKASQFIDENLLEEGYKDPCGEDLDEEPEYMHPDDAPFGYEIEEQEVV